MALYESMLGSLLNRYQTIAYYDYYYFCCCCCYVFCVAVSKDRTDFHEVSLHSSGGDEGHTEQALQDAFEQATSINGGRINEGVPRPHTTMPLPQPPPVMTPQPPVDPPPPVNEPQGSHDESCGLSIVQDSVLGMHPGGNCHKVHHYLLPFPSPPFFHIS